MAIIDARNSLLLLAGVRRPHGETEPTPDQQEQADKWATIVRFDWEPGNGTRYGLTYTIRQAPSLNHPAEREAVTTNDEARAKVIQFFTLTWHGAILADGRQLPASVGLSFSWDEFSHTNGIWFSNQVGINHADADGLLLLLEALGHSISYCDGGKWDRDRSAICWTRPPTPVLVVDDEGVTNADR